jgi:signal transduction histidine kinase
MKKLELSFSPAIALMFAGAIAISAAIGIFIYYSFKSLDEATWWRNHTYDVIHATSQLRIDLSDLESDTRGYILSQDNRFLNSYKQRSQVVSDDFSRLKILTHDRQNKNFKAVQVENLVSQRLDVLSNLVAVAQAKDSSAERKNKKITGLIRQGNLIRSVLNAQFASIELGEKELLRNRTLQLQRVDQQTRFLVYAGKIIAVILLIICFLKLNAEGLRRIKAEREQAILNDALEKQVAILDLSNHHLNTANKELEAFSYSVSHDLRAPLRSIDGFSQALLDFYSDKLDEEGQDYLNRIRNNSQRMARLIDDMLQLSRLTRAELLISKVNLSKIAQELADELRTQEPDRVVSFSIAPDMMVQGDKTLLAALLQNLLGNAWKFTSKHETGIVSFDSYLNEKEETVYRIQDDGAGFEMDFVDKLFGAFQRLHGMTEFKGTGIGLATCQRIVHRHGGKIWAEGAVEKGATFFFTLPS